MYIEHVVIDLQYYLVVFTIPCICPPFSLSLTRSLTRRSVKAYPAYMKRLINYQHASIKWNQFLQVRAATLLKAGTQYDAGASIVSQMSGRRWC